MALSCAIVRAVEETGLDMVYPSPPSPQVPSTNVLIAPLTIEVEEGTFIRSRVLWCMQHI